MASSETEGLGLTAAEAKAPETVPQPAEGEAPRPEGSAAQGEAEPAPAATPNAAAEAGASAASAAATAGDAAAGAAQAEQNCTAVVADGVASAPAPAPGQAQAKAQAPAEKLSEKAAAEILRQVEYYFSDSNLPRDKFLKEKIQEHEEGYVDLPLICSFSRMRRHLGLDQEQAASPGQVQAVARLLRAQAKTLRVSPDGLKVKREGALPLGEEHIAELNARSLFAAPFEHTTSLEDVYTFFAQYGTVRSVHMRRHADSKAFRGSLFVELASAEEMQKVAQLKGVMCNGVELRMEPKLDFIERCKRERLEGKDRQGSLDWGPDEEAEDHGRGGMEGGEGRGRGRGRDGFAKRKREGEDEEGDGEEGESGSFPKGLIVTFSLEEEAQAEEGKEKAGGGEPKANEEGGPEKGQGSAGEEGARPASAAVEATTGPEATDKPDANSKQASAGQQQQHQGGVAKSGFGALSRDEVRALFSEKGDVKFVDYSFGQPSGFIRFSSAAEAEAAAACDPLLCLKGFRFRCRVLQAEEEQQYWKKVRDSRWNKINSSGRGRGRGRGRRGGRGGRGGWRNAGDKGREADHGTSHRRFEAED